MPSTNSFPSHYQSMSYTLNTLFHLKQSLLFSSFLEFGFQPNTAQIKFSTPPFYFSSLPPRLFQGEEHPHIQQFVPHPLPHWVPSQQHFNTQMSN